jgi:hypothetical protein
VVVDLDPDRIDEFVSLLAPDFYADAETIRDAPSRQRSFTIIHLATASRIDISALRKDEYSQTSFARRRFEQSRLFSLEPMRFPLATTEDAILRKLEWCRAGGKTSEQRWNDLRSVVFALGETLDLTYLHHWAEYLKVSDLLESLLSE